MREAAKPSNTAKHYIDNAEFSDAMRRFHEFQNMDLLEEITERFFTPIARGVANKWDYFFSEDEDLIGWAVAACLAASLHPNAISHPFNFFTKVCRNKMMDVSRTDSGKAQKAKDYREMVIAAPPPPQSIKEKRRPLKAPHLILGVTIEPHRSPRS